MEDAPYPTGEGNGGVQHGIPGQQEPDRAPCPDRKRAPFMRSSLYAKLPTNH